MDDMSNRVRRNKLHAKDVSNSRLTKEEIECVKYEQHHKLLNFLRERKSPCAKCECLKIESTVEVSSMTMSLETRSAAGCIDHGLICPDLQEKQIMAKKSIWDTPFSTTTDPNDVKFSGYYVSVDGSDFSQEYLTRPTSYIAPEYLTRGLESARRYNNDTYETFVPASVSVPISKDVPQLSVDEIW